MMKKIRLEEYQKIANPEPGKIYRLPILTGEDQGKDLAGIFVILPSGHSVPYHYHRKRESILLSIGGEALEIYEDQEFPFRAGDILFIPSGVKHTTINRSQQEFRYLEFFTHPPAGSDFIEVK